MFKQRGTLLNTAPKGAPAVTPFKLLPIAGPHAVVLVALSVVSNILMLTGSVFMLQVYDRVLPSRSMPTLVALTLLVVVLYGFYALIEWIRSRMTARLGGMMAMRLSGPMLRASVRMKLLQEKLQAWREEFRKALRIDIAVAKAVRRIVEHGTDFAEHRVSR